MYNARSRQSMCIFIWPAPFYSIPTNALSFRQLRKNRFDLYKIESLRVLAMSTTTREEGNKLRHEGSSLCTKQIEKYAGSYLNRVIFWIPYQKYLNKLSLRFTMPWLITLKVSTQCFSVSFNWLQQILKDSKRKNIIRFPSNWDFWFL